MASFRYRVRTSEGRTQAGLVDATDAQEANAALIERGYEILLLEPITSGGISLKSIPFLNAIKVKDVVVVARTLSVMVSASVPLVDSLKNIARQSQNPKLRAVMADIAGEVESGARLSDALERHPKVFSSFFINMVRSGETSGQLEQVLEYLADQQEKDYDLTSKIRGAMIYPAFIIVVMAIVGFIMMTFVVPQLLEILKESNVALPLSTQILISVSGFFQHFWILILVVVFGAILGVRVALQTPGGRLIYDRILLNVPIFNQLLERIYVVRFCRSLSTLLRGGVDQVGALEIVAGVIGNQVWRNMVIETIKEINEGNSITTVFLRSKHIPTMMTQMMAVGEETGRLQEVLQRVAAFFNREVDNLVANLVTLIEPLVIVLLGGAVGIMVSAILLPLYQISSAG
jgi:type II secretory pathway component PulF